MRGGRVFLCFWLSRKSSNVSEVKMPRLSGDRRGRSQYITDDIKDSYTAAMLLRDITLDVLRDVTSSRDVADAVRLERCDGTDAQKENAAFALRNLAVNAENKASIERAGWTV